MLWLAECIILGVCNNDLEWIEQCEGISIFGEEFKLKYWIEKTGWNERDGIWESFEKSSNEHKGKAFWHLLWPEIPTWKLQN